MKKLIVLIPGNPSVPGIYDPFMNHLVNELSANQKTKHYVLSHLGQSEREQTRLSKINVRQVIQKHKITIEEILKKERPDEFILIGHSLGAAITICLSEHFKNEVSKFYLLCPFLGPSKNNLDFLKVIQNPITQTSLNLFLKILLKNQKACSIFIEYLTNRSILSPIIYQQIKKPSYIPNFLNLVSTYVDEFNNLDTKKSLENMDPNKTFFLFAPNDYWVPDDTFHFIPPRAKFRRCMDIKHDFCLDEDQYKIVSRIISEQYHNESLS